MLFDLTIPDGMGGIETAAEIRKPGAGVQPQVQIIVLSGYSNDPVMKNPCKYGFTASLSKPFTIAELSEILNNYFCPTPRKGKSFYKLCCMINLIPKTRLSIKWGS